MKTGNKHVVCAGIWMVCALLGIFGHGCKDQHVESKADTVDPLAKLTAQFDSDSAEERLRAADEIRKLNLELSQYADMLAEMRRRGTPDEKDAVEKTLLLRRVCELYATYVVRLIDGEFVHNRYDALNQISGEIAEINRHVESREMAMELLQMAMEDPVPMMRSRATEIFGQYASQYASPAPAMSQELLEGSDGMRAIARTRKLEMTIARSAKLLFRMTKCGNPSEVAAASSVCDAFNVCNYYLVYVANRYRQDNSSVKARDIAMCTVEQVLSSHPIVRRREGTNDPALLEVGLRMLSMALDDESTHIRYRAVRTLSQMGKKAASVSAALALKLNDLDEDVRKGAAIAVSNVGAVEAIPILMQWLDAEPKKRRWAIMGLDGIGPPAMAAVPMLRRIEIYDSDWETRQEAHGAIRSIAGECIHR